MNLALWLQRTATRVPTAPALMVGTDVVDDYAGFHAKAAALGAALQARGVRSGDRVAIFMANCPEFLIAFYGIWYAGAAAVPINAKLHGREAAWIIADSETRIALVTDKLGMALSDALETSCEVIPISSDAYADMLSAPPMPQPHPMGRDDMAWLFYTSGTTGKPKGVMMTTGNLTAMTTSYFIDVDEVRPEDAILYAAPMSHGAGIYNFMHVLKGCRHVIPPSGGFDPAEILSLSAELRNVSFFAAPTMVKRLVEVARASGQTGDGIKTVVYAGGPMYLADIVDAVEVMGPRFVQVYGQGESPMCITALSRADVADREHPNWRSRVGSVGLAQSVVEVAIFDAEGTPLPPGQTGEIVVRGPSVMKGYWNRPDATAETIRDGWLWTGDMGVMDEDGYLTMQDRSKDMIISGGSNVYPREVEEVLLQHPSVREVSVVGRPHPEWGEEIVAFVALNASHGLDEAALDQLCLENIARFKRPKAYLEIADLPKNNYGKVLKTELRTLLKDRQDA